MNKQIIVIKIGGSTLGQHDTTLEDLVELQKRGTSVVVIHGGGKIITEWLGKFSSNSQFINGERVTDKTGLEVATAVLAGVVNKELVANLNALGAKALGLSGVDGKLLIAVVKNRELGYVGNIEKVNIDLLKTIIDAGFIPIISSVSYNPAVKLGSGPQILNVNADVAAGEITAALGASKLVFLTDIAGVCDKDGRVIASLNIQEAEALIASGIASKGMIPKITSSIRAAIATGIARIIDGRRSHALLNEILHSEGGTTIYNRSSEDVNGKKE
jgi:acetylglutamate kinase